MKTKPLFLLVCCLFGFTLLKAEPLANLVYLAMDCGSGGEVEFELTGDPDLYTYYWDHGPRDLHLTNLEPGTYTLTVRDFYGCEEEYEIEIVDFSNCVVQVDWYPSEPCTAVIEITVIDSITGEELNSDYLTVEWQDDPDAGVRRIVPQYQVAEITYYYNVYANGTNDEICCETSGSVTVGPNENQYADCADEPQYPIDSLCPRIVINEISGVKDGPVKVQYVELLVVCEGDCGNKVDIRGFIIDDNNGSLIRGGSLVSQNNMELIGVNEGYLMFQYIENWQAVPNGSLIVIYEEGEDTGEYFPADDPTDANEDGVYVLAANNSQYLFGRLGEWNSLSNTMEYEGNFANPSWELMEISEHADGVQTRNVQGHLSHGVSMGQSIYASEEEYEIHLHNNDPRQANCQLDQSDYNNRDNYLCLSESNGIGSPGLANSDANASLINHYRNCDQPCNPCLDGPIPNSLSNQANNSLVIYPNPFRSTFSLDYISHEQGVSTIELFDASSISIHEQKIETIRGKNTEQISSLSLLPSGVYFMRFKFPNGEVIQKRIIHIQD